MALTIENRKARHSYHILKEYEAGIVLQGTEIKSIRNGGVHLKDAYCRVNKQLELEVLNLHISLYGFGNRFNHEATRPRKLLMHKKEIVRLASETQEKGLSLIPLRLYFKKNHLKMRLGLCRGKKLFDKRHSLKQKMLDREAEQAIKRG